MSMYNKIFTKILDSSIWLEPSPTRLVWITLIAAMDEDGFAQFASVPNLAHRARVTEEECNGAVTVLEGPDANSADPDNEGRRIERVPGGWMILNAAKYRGLVTRLIIKEQTRKRVAKHRAEKRGVTVVKRTCNAPVTPSVSVSVSVSEAGKEKNKEVAPLPFDSPDFFEAWERWEKFRKEIKKPLGSTARASQLSKLKKMGKACAIESIDNSINGGWQGLFEPKGTNGNGNHAKPESAWSLKQRIEAAEESKAAIMGLNRYKNLSDEKQQKVDALNDSIQNLKQQLALCPP